MGRLVKDKSIVLDGSQTYAQAEETILTRYEKLEDYEQLLGVDIIKALADTTLQKYLVIHYADYVAQLEREIMKKL